jgi:hypothetical protein
MVIPTQGWGVIFGRRYPRLGGQFSTPIHTERAVEPSASRAALICDTQEP